MKIMQERKGEKNKIIQCIILSKWNINENNTCTEI